jgi:hypothetical protein
VAHQVESEIVIVEEKEEVDLIAADVIDLVRKMISLDAFTFQSKKQILILFTIIHTYTYFLSKSLCAFLMSLLTHW